MVSLLFLLLLLMLLSMTGLVALVTAMYKDTYVKGDTTMSNADGQVVGTRAATHDLPLLVAPVLPDAELFSVETIRLTLPGSPAGDKAEVGSGEAINEVGPSEINSFRISRVQKVNSTAVVFHALGGEQIRVWNGVTTVRLSATGPEIPVCSADVTCAAFQVEGAELAEKYLAQAEALLVPFEEGRRRLSERFDNQTKLVGPLPKLATVRPRYYRDRFGPAAPSNHQTKSSETTQLNESPTSRMVYVVSLQGVNGANPKNEHRLDNFRDDWKRLCGVDANVSICPGTVSLKRGYGVTQTYVRCFQKAIDDGVMFPEFYEDDARFFTPDGCKPREWTDLPTNTFLVMLGGHAWKYGSKGVVGYRHSTFSYGTYGFMVPKTHLQPLIRGYQRDLQSGLSMLSPDISWYNIAKRVGKRIYALDPLMVQHIAGWSNTWGKERAKIADGGPRLWVDGYA